MNLSQADDYLNTERAGTLRSETISVYRPVVRSFLSLVALYYVVTTFNHFGSETGVALFGMAALSIVSSISAGLFYIKLRDEITLTDLEIGGLIGNGLLLINLLYYYGIHYDSGRLVYFVLMTFVFSITGVSRRVAIISSLVALASLYYVIRTNDPQLLGQYFYIGLTASFVAIGASLMMRQVIVDALHAKLSAAERREEALAAAENATKLSITDSLTGLPNRLDFFQTLKRSVEQLNDTEDKTQLAVFLIDLDAFKPVNDTYGHGVGDALLAGVGSRLKTALPSTSYFARLGGDEFAAIVTVEDSNDAKELGDKICEHMRAPFNLGRVIVHVGATVGVALKTNAITKPATLIEHADYALYNAKRSQKGVCLVFSEKDEGEMKHLFLVDQALRSCDLEQELTVYYQPQVDIVEDRIIGFEVLARWNNKSLGRISPDTFIKVAEGSGLITKITQVLLKKALLDIVDWPRDISVSFNLSVHDILDESAIKNILGIVAESSIDPSRICFEITETVMMSDVDQACLALQALVDAGHEIALDDFGTGYSSFAYLHKLPIDKIKIDGAFVRGVSVEDQSSEIISTILSLSRSLKMVCIIEGVETEVELAAMQCLGARIIQGFYFGKPMKASEAHAKIVGLRDAGASDQESEQQLETKAS